jgi:hypothetical protein
MMNRQETVQKIVAHFTNQISKYSEGDLERLESGKLVINITPAVGKEAGGIKGLPQPPVKRQAP